VAQAAEKIELFDVNSDEELARQEARLREAERIIEALLFASAEPLDEAEMTRRLEEGVELDRILERLRAHYSGRGVNLTRVGKKWFFRTAADLNWILAREQDARAEAAVARIAADGRAGAAGARAAHDPGRHWMGLLFHLPEDRLGDVVVGAPVGGAFGVGELVHEMPAGLAREPQTGRYCQGETPTLADCCLIPQVFNAERFQVDLAPYPTIRRIHAACAELPAFAAAHPARQPDAE